VYESIVEGSHFIPAVSSLRIPICCTRLPLLSVTALVTFSSLEHYDFLPIPVSAACWLLTVRSCEILGIIGILPSRSGYYFALFSRCKTVFIGWQWCNFVSHLGQLIFAAVLWVPMFVTVIALKYALLWNIRRYWYPSSRSGYYFALFSRCKTVFIGWQWCNFVPHLCQLIFAAVLWVPRNVCHCNSA